MPDASLRIDPTGDLALVRELAAHHPHINRPTADADAKTFFVAWDGDDPVATAWIRPLAPGVGATGGLFVVPEHRGEGLGGRMLDRSLRELVDRGVRVATLGVNLSNHEATAFYRARGFRTVGVAPGVHPGDDGDGLGRRLDELAPLPLPQHPTRIMARFVP